MSLFTSILMPNSVSPSSVAFDGKRIYALDGITPYVYTFDTDGIYIDRFRTVRAYQSAEYDEAGGRFCCIGGGRQGRIYTANGRFEEICSVEAEFQDNSDRSGIMSASYRSDGNGFEIAHRHSLRIYALDGSFDRTVTRTPVGRTFLNWNEFDGRRALHYEENGRRYITVDRIGGTIPDNVMLKSLFSYKNELYGGFSWGYLYTYIIPLFCEGKMNTSVFGNFAYVANGVSKK